jgi:hypothetical protein
LYVSFFSASFSVTILSAVIATSNNKLVLSFSVLNYSVVPIWYNFSLSLSLSLSLTPPVRLRDSHEKCYWGSQLRLNPISVKTRNM